MCAQANAIVAEVRLLIGEHQGLLNPKCLSYYNVEEGVMAMVTNIRPHVNRAVNLSTGQVTITISLCFTIYLFQQGEKEHDDEVCHPTFSEVKKVSVEYPQDKVPKTLAQCWTDIVTGLV